VVRDLVDELDPEAETIVLVMDNLNSHRRQTVETPRSGERSYLKKSQNQVSVF
jgi:hypothetical protein